MSAHNFDDTPTYVPTGDERDHRAVCARPIATTAQHAHRMRRGDSAVRFRDHGRTEVP